MLGRAMFTIESSSTITRCAVVIVSRGRSPVLALVDTVIIPVLLFGNERAAPARLPADRVDPESPSPDNPFPHTPGAYSFTDTHTQAPDGVAFFGREACPDIPAPSCQIVAPGITIAAAEVAVAKGRADPPRLLH